MALSSQLPAYQALFAVGVIACLSACVTQDAKPVPKSALVDPAPPIVHQTDAASVEGWQAETFALPPAFAPDLPQGTESLRFAPGWRNPHAEGFWSYAFVMWIDEPVPDAARIDALLEKYYTGLMTSFAADKGKVIPPAQVEVKRTAPKRYVARMHLTDAFATFEPIDLRILIDALPETSKSAVLRIQISPQPPDHAIWRSLNAALVSIPPRDTPAPVKPNDPAPPSTDHNSR
jgi:hypothetical protein